MKVEAIFFDLDGTLVSSASHVVPESAKAALRRLRENGIRVFVATGRSKDGLDVLEGMTFDGYVTLNGQYCYAGDTVLYENTIAPGELAILLAETEKHPFPCHFMTDQGAFYNYRDSRVEEINDITQNDDHPVRSIEDIYGLKVYQVGCYISKDEEAQLMKKLTQCTSARWHPYFTDISPVGGTKKNGIGIMLSHFDIPVGATMAFGDGGNDAEMLAFVHTAVVMADGMEEVRRMADYIAPGADEDGIKVALEHFGLV